MNYFNNFPKIKDNINGYQYDVIDITYAPYEDAEDYPLNTETLPSNTEVGNLSLQIYDDANNFWALMLANDQINPWKFFLENLTTFQERNSKFYGFFAKYSTSSKLSSDAYVDFQPEDIVIRGQFFAGATTASSVFSDYDTLTENNFNLDAWVVQKAYTDTRKAKITKNLNLGNTGTQIIGEGENILILRKGSSGYEILSNPFTTANKNIDSLSHYEYLESPVEFREKGKSDIILAPSVAIEENDTILSVITNNGPGSSGLISYENISTTNVQNFETNKYFEKNKFKYLNNTYLSKILSRLI